MRCRYLVTKALIAADTLSLIVRSVGWNQITGDEAEALAKVVLDSTSLTEFCGIPLVALRENTIEEVNLHQKGVGVPGAIVLSRLLPASTALKTLKCACLLMTNLIECQQQ